MASSLGRGRGRGISYLKSQPDKKPGSSENPPAEMSADKCLAILIQSLSIEPDEIELKPVADACQKSCVEKSQIEVIVKKLYERCCEDWHFAGTAAALAKQISNVEADEESIRAQLLRTIQKDFKEMNQLRCDSHKKFLGCVSFLCQVLGNIRDANSNPLKPLVKPVLQIIDVLLDNKATLEEMECAAVQLSVVYEVLHSHANKDMLRSTKNLIKDKVVSTDVTPDIRYKLLDIVEKFAALTKLK